MVIYIYIVTHIVPGNESIDENNKMRKKMRERRNNKNNNKS